MIGTLDGGVKGTPSFPQYIGDAQPPHGHHGAAALTAVSAKASNKCTNIFVLTDGSSRTRISPVQKSVKLQLRPIGPSGHPRCQRRVATLIVASLEGALMMSRIQRNDELLRRVQSHLNQYLDREMAAV
jgi:hypothetical protein